MDEVMKQVGAIPYQVENTGALKVLLVTSRETGRWVIPKGWPMKKLRDYRAAQKEAEEEAGVCGRVKRTPAGRYEYFKRTQSAFELVEVTVYLLEVKKLRDKWPEMDERKRRWFPYNAAVREVIEPGLKTILRLLPGSIG